MPSWSKSEQRSSEVVEPADYADEARFFETGTKLMFKVGEIAHDLAPKSTHGGA